MNTSRGLMEIQDPKAALSLTVAGGAVVAITTTLSNAFDAPAAWTALILSMCFSGVIIKEWRKDFFNFLLVGFVIFHLARGGNMTLSKLEGSIIPPQAEETTMVTEPASQEWSLFPSAYAATIQTNSATTNRPSLPPPPRDNKKKQREQAFTPW